MENILRIKEILEEKDISLKDFAKMTGLSYNYCSEIVRGSKFPRPDTLINISTALDIDLPLLFKPTKEPKAIDIVRQIKNYANQLENKL